MHYITVVVLIISVKVYVVETDLRSNVIWSATESSCGWAFKYAFFAHAKVCQLTVTIFVKKNVVQF